jgi:hypothetical protein
MLIGFLRNNRFNPMICPNPSLKKIVPIDSVADKSNTPTSKMVLINIRKHVGN